MIETTKLNDGTEITIRTREEDDLDAVFAFYSSLPPEERELLKLDVTDKRQVKRRFEEFQDNDGESLIALQDDKVIAEGIIEAMRYGWLRKTGEIRVLTSMEHRNDEVDSLLIKELFLLGARRGMNHLLARVLQEEQFIFDTLKSLSFEHEATQEDHATDIQGNTHDVYLLTYSLKRMWENIEGSVRQKAFRREY